VVYWGLKRLKQVGEGKKKGELPKQNGHQFAGTVRRRTPDNNNDGRGSHHMMRFRNQWTPACSCRTGL